MYKVYDHVKRAVETYYEHNTHRGCTKDDSPNFCFQANVDDGTCEPVNTNFTFGGVYQTCNKTGVDNLCNQMSQKNPLTGNYSCPLGYKATVLQSGTKKSSRSERRCRTCWFFFHCCDSITYKSYAFYTAYWCAASGQVTQGSGFLFGGLYTDHVNNIQTESKTCPQKFVPLSILDGLYVCVSNDYETGFDYSLPFAGFFSCTAGNPLALKESASMLKNNTLNTTSSIFQQGVEAYPHKCPIGYSQQLALVTDDCSINYCVKTGASSPKRLPLIQRPPFIDAPRSVDSLMDSDVIIDDSGEIWTSQQNGDKVMPDYLKQMGYTDQMTTTESTTNGVS